LIPYAVASAAQTASAVSSSVRRCSRKVAASAIRIQTSPSVPSRESAAKSQFSQPTRWWTTHDCRWRSRLR
jgi:hypothetical protein